MSAELRGLHVLGNRLHSIWVPFGSMGKAQKNPWSCSRQLQEYMLYGMIMRRTCIAWKSRVECICICMHQRKSWMSRTTRNTGKHGRTMMHFLLFSFPSLHSSDCGASRSLSKVYVEFGSSYGYTQQVSTVQADYVQSSSPR